MKRLILFLMISIIMGTPVSAGLTKLDIPLFVDFISDSEFYLNWDGGLHHFVWDNASYPNDINISMAVYRDLNETVVCAEQSTVFSSLTDKMGGVMDICGRLADNNNVSMAFTLSDIQYSLGLQTQKLTECNTKLETAEERAGLYDTCKTQKDQYQSDWNMCNTQLTDAQKSSKSNPIIWALIAAGITYFLMKKKKPIPSEYSEEGYEEDYEL